jgi:hypothetical protein
VRPCPQPHMRTTAAITMENVPSARCISLIALTSFEVYANIYCRMRCIIMLVLLAPSLHTIASPRCAADDVVYTEQ